MKLRENLTERKKKRYRKEKKIYKCETQPNASICINLCDFGKQTNVKKKQIGSQHKVIVKTGKLKKAQALHHKKKGSRLEINRGSCSKEGGHHPVRKTSESTKKGTKNAKQC